MRELFRHVTKSIAHRVRPYRYRSWIFTCGKATRAWPFCGSRAAMTVAWRFRVNHSLFETKVVVRPDCRLWLDVFMDLPSADTTIVLVIMVLPSFS